MRVIILKFAIATSILACLSACASTAENFDCPAGSGLGCHSITQVNQKVNEGLNTTLNNKTTQKPKAYERSEKTKISSSSAKPKAGAGAGAGFKDFKVQRVREVHLRIWFAPFQDSMGNFHEDSIVHTVLSPGFWQVDECSQN